MHQDESRGHHFLSPPGPTHSTEDVRVRYAYSYERQSEDYPEGVDAQYLENAQLAASHGYTIPNTPEFRFNDNDTSGVTKARQGLNRLLTIVRSGEGRGERVYVRNRKRLGRFLNPKRHAYYEVEFADHGAPIVYSNRKSQPTDFEHDTSPAVVGEYLMDAMEGLEARGDRLHTLTESNKGTRLWTRNGFYTLKRPFYATQRWLADTKTGALIQPVPFDGTIKDDRCRYKLAWATDGSVQVVRDIFGWIAQGKSLRAIAHMLTARGEPPPSARYARAYRRHGNGWHPQVVGAIARNPIYMGDLVLNRTVKRYRGQEAAHRDRMLLDAYGKVLVPDFIADPPIACADWHAVQDILNGTAAACTRTVGRRASQGEFVLSGVLRCGHCEQSYSGHRRPPHRAGQPVSRYYRHHTPASPHLPRCTHKVAYVRAETLESAVLALVDQVLLDPALADHVQQEVTRLTSQAETTARVSDAAALRTTLAKQQQALDNVNYRLSMPGTEPADIASLQRVKEQLAREVGATERELKAIDAEAERLAHVQAAQPARSAERLALRARFEAATLAERKRILAMIVERIVIDAVTGRVEVRARAG